MTSLAAYARLLRVSNAPTAVADVWMGYAVATGVLEPTWTVAALTLASLCLYHGGMVRNDAVDAERDAADDRGRPIAAGAVRRETAFRVAAALLVAGVVLAGAASALAGGPAAALVAAALCAAVLAYNSRLKRTVFGPPLMGSCRALNGLLGMSPALTAGVGLAIGPGVLAYIAGVTWLARDEAIGGRRAAILGSGVVALAGIGWLVVAPWVVATAPWPLATNGAWAMAWGVMTLLVARNFATPLLDPRPRRVQGAVGRGIRALVLVDALLATLYTGPLAGLAILALLPVTMLLARFVPQT